jgi:hypothetical protein
VPGQLPVDNSDQACASCSTGLQSAHHPHDAPVPRLAECRRDDFLGSQLIGRHHLTDLHGATMVSAVGRRTAFPRAPARARQRRGGEPVLHLPVKL